MKLTSIAFLIFCLASPFLSSAQQNSTSRTPAPEETLDQQRGELSGFNNLLFRYQAASEEGELQSMEDIRQEVLKMMDREIEQHRALAAAKAKADKPADDWLQAQVSQRDLLKTTKLSLPSKGEEVKELEAMRAFAKLMENDIAAFEAAMKANHRD